jgi:hypothetical protein
MAIRDSDDCAVFGNNSIAGTIPLKIFNVYAKILRRALPTIFAERKPRNTSSKIGFLTEV